MSVNEFDPYEIFKLWARHQMMNGDEKPRQSAMPAVLGAPYDFSSVSIPKHGLWGYAAEHWGATNTSGAHTPLHPDIQKPEAHYMVINPRPGIYSNYSCGICPWFSFECSNVYQAQTEMRQHAKQWEKPGPLTEAEKKFAVEVYNDVRPKTLYTD